MRALVLSGGSAKGAYSAGCIKYIMGELKINYDIFLGISSGGINCGYLAQFPNGQEELAANTLVDLWSKLHISHIYKRWKFFGKLSAIWKQSFYDSTPLLDMIKKNISLEKIRASGKKVGIGTVSISSGKYHTFTQDDDDFIEGVVAGASFPVVFSPVSLRGQLWTDGGIKAISPLHSAIDMGATQIDLIVTSPETRIKKFIEKPSILDIFTRVLDLATDKISSNDIEKLLMHNKLAEAGLTDKKIIKLNIIRPTHNLTEDLLDFSSTKIKEMLGKGYQDAKDKYII